MNPHLLNPLDPEAVSLEEGSSEFFDSVLVVTVVVTPLVGVHQTVGVVPVTSVVAASVAAVLSVSVLSSLVLAVSFAVWVFLSVALLESSPWLLVSSNPPFTASTETNRDDEMKNNGES